jgi:3-hydroxyisobutyrate dehydrogenase-like beta-hydroxyacid dehydrogenase
MNMFEYIGFIGLGMMGIPMSKKLIEAGYKVVGYDIDPGALEQAKENGVEIAQSPRELGESCNPVITIVPNSDVVEDVVLGTDGVIQGAGNGDVLIEMTTAYPISTIKMAKILEARGIRMLDAPVSGGIVGAEKGTLSIIVGGDIEIFEQCMPLFKVMGQNIFHMGAIGAGHTMKAVNNFLSGCSMVATSEAVALATKAGKKVVDVLQVSTGRNYATEWKFPRFVLPRKFDDGFRIELFNKDLDILTRLARELGVPMFIANTVQQIFNLAMSKGYGLKGHTAIAQLIEEWAGIKMEE